MGLKIPAAVLQNDKLSLNERGLLSILYGFAEPDGTINQSVDSILSIAKISRTTYYNYIKKIKQLDLLETQQQIINGRYTNSLMFLKVVK